MVQVEEVRHREQISDFGIISVSGEEKVSLVELLVKHGAKLNVLTVRGYTPLDRCVFHYVIGNYNKEILKILVKAGAKLKPLTGQQG